MSTPALSIFSSVSDILFFPSVLVSRDTIMQMPDKPGVYFVVDPNNKILYIGKSVNLRQRWLAHHRFPKAKSVEGCRIFFFEAPPSTSIESLEKSLIELFNPEWNGQVIEKEYKSSGSKSEVIVARVTPEVKAMAEALAASENRNLSNFIETMVIERARQARGEGKSHGDVERS